MLVPGLVLSAVVPLLAGLPWLLSIQRQPAGAPGGWPLALGYGYALGLVIVCAGMAALSLAHLSISLLNMSIAPLATGVIGWWRMRGVVGVIRADATAAIQVSVASRSRCMR